MRLPVPLSFYWDKGNVDKSWKKHKVYFREAEEVFFNTPLALYRDVKHTQIEDRYIGLGVTNKGRRLNISFTIRENKVRVISARDMSRKERWLYAKKEK